MTVSSSFVTSSNAAHEHAELEVGVAFLVDQLLDLGGSAVGEDEGRGHFGDGVHEALQAGFQTIIWRAVDGVNCGRSQYRRIRRKSLTDMRVIASWRA
jgi:hypothetical protein